MKKLLVLVFAMFFAIGLKAQMWCPPGAEWHFSAYAIYPSANGYYKVKYINDTVISGLTYKKLIKSFNGFNIMYGPSYVSYTSNVYYTREHNNIIYLNTDTLFNFNATIGSKWLRARVMQNFTVNTFCDAPRRYVTVLDTGHITINALYLKTLKLQYEYKTVETATNFPLFTNTVTVCEKIGDLYGGFEPTACETYSTIFINHPISDAPFRCYSDNNFVLYTNPQYLGACTYVATTNLNEIKIDVGAFKIYPNPTAGIFNIDIESVNKIQVINMLGELVKEEQLILKKQNINI